MPTPLRATLASLSLLAAAACSNASDATTATAAHLEANDVQRVDPPADLSYADVANGNLELGSDLAAAIPTDDGNLVFSPASLSIAFAMLREGAAGPTAEEIDQVLHLSTGRSAAYNGLLHELSDVGHGSTLELNDALFLDPHLTVKRSYLEAVKKWYGVGVEQTEFPHPALEVINAWADDKTHGRIPELLDTLDPLDVFALVNTIYLNAKWQEPFDVSDTSKDSFSTGDGARTPVSTMHQGGVFDYADTSDWQAVRLPYKGGELSMVVLLPTGATDPVELLKPEVLAAADSHFSSQPVELALPTWELDTRSDLVEILKGLGLHSAFEEGGDFSELTPDETFRVSQVVQQANITVGEEGTEASAATAIIGRVASAVPPAQDAISFVADHPFAFAIVHDSTGVPLFEGVVGDPS